MNITFFFVCQEGLLEAQAAVLAASLRYHLDVPLVAALSGKVHEITLKVLDTFGVQAVPIVNNFNPPYPEGNKLIAYNIPSDCDYRVWLDSDMLLTKPFDMGLLTQGDGVFLDAPKYEVITNLDWRKSFEILDMDYRYDFRYTRACLLSTRNSTGFHEKWYDNCLKLRSKAFGYLRTPRQVDQIGLTLTYLQYGDGFKKVIHNYKKNPIFAFPDDIYVFDGKKIILAPFLVLQKHYMYFERQGKPVPDRSNPQSLAYYDEIRSVIYSLLARYPLIDRIPAWTEYYDIYLKN